MFQSWPSFFDFCLCNLTSETDISDCLPVQSPASCSWSWKLWFWTLFITSVWWSSLTRQALAVPIIGPGRNSFASTWEQTNAATYTWWMHSSATRMSTRCVEWICKLYRTNYLKIICLTVFLSPDQIPTVVNNPDNDAFIVIRYFPLSSKINSIWMFRNQ